MKANINQFKDNIISFAHPDVIKEADTLFYCKENDIFFMTILYNFHI